MNTLTTAGKNLLLNELKNSAGYIAIYTSIAEEDVKAITWNTVSNGELSMASPVTFNISAGTTVTKVILYDDAAGTNQYVEADLVNEETFVGSGLYTLDSWTISL